MVVRGTPVGTLGLTICYDLRFPAIFERLSEAGAEVIAVPAAFTVPTGEAHWHVLLRARAIEAGLFVVAAAQSGITTTAARPLATAWWSTRGARCLPMAARARICCSPRSSWIGSPRLASRIPVLSHRRTIAPVGD